MSLKPVLGNTISAQRAYWYHPISLQPQYWLLAIFIDISKSALKCFRSMKIEIEKTILDLTTTSQREALAKELTTSLDTLILYLSLLILNGKGQSCLRFLRQSFLFSRNIIRNIKPEAKKSVLKVLTFYIRRRTR